MLESSQVSPYQSTLLCPVKAPVRTSNVASIHRIKTIGKILLYCIGDWAIIGANGGLRSTTYTNEIHSFDTWGEGKWDLETKETVLHPRWYLAMGFKGDMHDIDGAKEGLTLLRIIIKVFVQNLVVHLTLGLQRGKYRRWLSHWSSHILRHLTTSHPWSPLSAREMQQPKTDYAAILVFLMIFHSALISNMAVIRIFRASQKWLGSFSYDLICFGLDEAMPLGSLQHKEVSTHSFERILALPWQSIRGIDGA